MMKKMLALLLAVAALVSLGTTAVFAKMPGSEIGVHWTPGGYSCKHPEDFVPVGDIQITRDPDASMKLDLSDGDMSDWVAADYGMYTIDGTNMVYWEPLSTVPEGWNMSMFFVADSEWLYFGFYINDPAFAYTHADNYHAGDSIQLCLDFGRKTGDMLEQNPEDAWNPKNIFYSFGCVEDGAPIRIMRQESDDDRWLSEENGDGVKGSARATETGWSAEFALSWQQLYDDYTFKAWDDPSIYIGGEQELPLNIGCCLYYLNVDDGMSGSITWAAGTTQGITDDAGIPQISWTAYDNGIGLYLPYEENMGLKCDGIVDMGRGYQTVPPSPETEPPVPEPEPAPEPQRPETQKPTESTPPEVVTKPQPAPPAESDPLPMDEELEMLLDKYGCSGVIGTGALSALMVAAAWVLLCKKKD